MLRIGIVGCGKIAEAHAEAIKHTPEAELVATCDLEILMARQLAERFAAKAFYDDLARMLTEVKPEVVHITTPPQSHYIIARTCLEAGCHVLVEKPFTVNTEEAESLINLARAKNLKLTVGTDEQFSNVAMEMRELIKQGWLGGDPIHLDVYYCYDLGDERYARAFLKNRSHWIWQLPGQLIQNIIPHAVMKIAEYLNGSKIKVIAEGFTSHFLKNLGEIRLKDELRALIVDENQTSAYLTFSTSFRPPLRQLLICGPENSLLLDQDHQALVRIPGRTYKSYLDKTLPLNYLARQYRKNLFKNIRLFLKKKFQMKRGLFNLINFFYESIKKDGPEPIPYEQILLGSKIVDSIVSEVYKDSKQN